MRKRLYTVIIVIALAIAFTVIPIALPALFAAKNMNLNASTTVNFRVFPPAETQKAELNNMGLDSFVNEDGTLTLNPTTVEPDTVSTSSMRARHKELIEKGILRYAIYDGTLCEQSQKDKPSLIVILDFTNYNIREFQSGFLKSLTYAIIGSNKFISTGSNFTETNGEGGTLTVYDSSNGGTVLTDPVTLTLRGFYNSEGLLTRNSYITMSDGATHTIEQYSIRLILPRNPQKPVTLKKDSLTLTGVELGDFSPKQPDCIGLGISHLDIDAKNYASSIVIEQNAADSMHFHWLTVTGSQMEFSLLRLLSNMLGVNGASVKTGHVDELFRKPDSLTDFSYLFMRAVKSSESEAIISLYDSPYEKISESQNLAAAIRLFYWFERVYDLQSQNVNNLNLEFRRFGRLSDNSIHENYDAMTYDRESSYLHQGERCYSVSHRPDSGTGNAEIMGYFSDSGKLYDANWNPIAA